MNGKESKFFQDGFSWVLTEQRGKINKNLTACVVRKAEKSLEKARKRKNRNMKATFFNSKMFLPLQYNLN